MLTPLLVGTDVGPNSKDWAKRVLAALDLELVDRWTIAGQFSFWARHDQLLDITGYDLMIGDGFSTSSSKEYTTSTGGRYTVTLDQDRRHLNVTDSRGRTLRFDAGTLADRLRSDKDRFDDVNRMPQEVMILETSVPGLKGRILFRQLSGRAEKIQSGSFSLFLSQL